MTSGQFRPILSVRIVQRQHNRRCRQERQDVSDAFRAPWSSMPSLPLHTTDRPAIAPLCQRKSTKAGWRPSPQAVEDIRFQVSLVSTSGKKWRVSQESSNLVKEEEKGQKEQGTLHPRRGGERNVGPNTRKRAGCCSRDNGVPKRPCSYRPKRPRSLSAAAVRSIPKPSTPPAAPQTRCGSHVTVHRISHEKV